MKKPITPEYARLLSKRAARLIDELFKADAAGDFDRAERIVKITQRMGKKIDLFKCLRGDYTRKRRPKAKP